VGGTHYYTQSLLFKYALADEQHREQEAANYVEDSSETFPILKEPTEIILTKLRDVDPVMADRWHPNDRRKIQRSLEIWLKTGKSASQTYEEQRTAKHLSSGNGNDSHYESNAMAEGSSLRFPMLLFWVHAETGSLRLRLEDRVDTMIQNGLLADVETLDSFLRNEQQAGRDTDKSRGIWVSIGYKEFESYQAALKQGLVSDKELDKLKALALEQTKAATRQYAKRQVRWIRIKLLHALSDAGAMNKLYLLDGTDIQDWEARVLKPALSLTERFLHSRSLPNPASLSAAAEEMLTPKRHFDMSQRRDLWQRRTCEACDAVFVTESDWEHHLRSKGHKRAVATKKQGTANISEEKT